MDQEIKATGKIIGSASMEEDILNKPENVIFAHMADCHIGGWRDPKLKQISAQAFSEAVDICIGRKISFLLISGDLFNSSLPNIESLKSVTYDLKRLKDADISVYIVPGSHDFSTSGRTMIDVLENAGLLVNVVKAKIIDGKLCLEYTKDRSGVLITGLLGRKGMLEKSYYETLDRDRLDEIFNDDPLSDDMPIDVKDKIDKDAYRIFMFHTALTEFKPKELANMDSQPLSLLPKGFDYYAGGHVHYIFQKEEPDYGMICYPGPLFPNNFAEIEKLGYGGFFICETKGFTEYVPLEIKKHVNVFMDCSFKTPEQITAELTSMLSKKELDDGIVTIRLEGIMESGKVSDIDFRAIFAYAYDTGSYFVMKNLSKLKTKEFEEIKVNLGDVEQIEQKVIEEGLDRIKVDSFKEGTEKRVAAELLRVFALERGDGETVIDYEKRLSEEIKELLKS